jgi:enamine deaminase RidA (YjgF/YER057c/UK114 family)
MNSVNDSRGEAMTERTTINPWSWSLRLGFDQAQLIEGHQRQLVCSGQDAVDADGNPQHPGDMAAQLELALDNLQAVLAAADMTSPTSSGSMCTPPTSTSCSSTGHVFRTVSGTPMGAL